MLRCLYHSLDLVIALAGLQTATAQDLLYTPTVLDTTRNKNVGTSQLLSAPYALNAGNSFPKGNANGNIPYWNGSQWITNTSNIYNDGVNVGIGTVTPKTKLAAIGTVDFSRTGADGMTYNFSMSDSISTLDSFLLPHLSLFAGPPIGLHSILSLENNSLCCGEQELTAVVGVIDNTTQFHHVLKATTLDFYLLARELNNTSGKYRISSSGISFIYSDINSDTEWLLSNKAGRPGQVLTLNTTADTATWSNISNFSATHYFTPVAGSSINVLKGSNIIESAGPLTTVNINMPANDDNGDIITLSFAGSISNISYTGGTLANPISSALPGAAFNYIYCSASGKWYNW